MENSLVKYEDQQGFLSKLLESKTLPAHIKTTEQAFLIVNMGRELGLEPIQSLHFIIPIQGKLSLSAKAIGAILRKGGVKFRTIHDAEYLYEDNSTSTLPTKLDGKKAIDRITTMQFWRGKDIEDSEVVEFRWSDAASAGYTAKDNYKKYPREMMWARCLSKGANRVASDLLLGLYCTEELYDSIPGANVKRDNDTKQIIEILQD